MKPAAESMLGKRLTEPQRRHMRELYGDGSEVLFWHTGYGTPEHRCAEVLARRGLVVLEGSLISREGGGYRLTTEGRTLHEQQAWAADAGCLRKRKS